MDWLKSRFVQVGVVVILAIGAVLFYSIYSFRLNSTTPKNNQKGASIDQQITLTFNRILGSTEATKVNINNRQVESFQATDKTLTIDLPLLPYTEYRVLVSDIQSDQGKIINQVSLTFVTGDLSAQAKQVKQDFLASLPVFFEDFSVDYTVTTNIVNVEIIAGPENTTKKKALDYLSQYHITDATDTISFFVIPAISGQAGP